MFTRWTTISLATLNRHNQRRWRCVCSCGTIRDVLEYALIAGSSKSCGCFRDDFARERKTIHGAHKTAEYRSWHGIKSRCGRTPNYVDVTLCERWQKFENFRDDVLHEIGPRPAGKSIDRINNARGYEPGNIRWATLVEQNRNRSCVNHVEHDGKRVALSALAASAGLTAHLLLRRIRSGWTLKRALATPSQKGKGHDRTSL